MQTITDTVTNSLIEFPDNVAWILDNNYVRVIQQDGHPVEVTVHVTIAGSSYYYEYNSELNDITFRLNTLFWAFVPFFYDLEVTIRVAATSTQNTVILGSNYSMLHGKTLQERYHGSARVITFEDNLADLSALEIYYPFGAINGRIIPDSDAEVAATGGVGIYTISCENSRSITIKNSLLPPLKRNFGDIWNEVQLSQVTYELRSVCRPDNGIKLTYVDTDGCTRYAIGEVLKKTMKADRNEYRRGGTVFNSVPRSRVSSYTGEIQVGFADVDPLQYLEDIMLSPYVIADSGNSARLIPTTLQLERDGETKDIIINFKIDA